MKIHSKVKRNPKGKALIIAWIVDSHLSFLKNAGSTKQIFEKLYTEFAKRAFRDSCIFGKEYCS